VYDNTGKVCYLVPSALVIQERKLAETALQASELALMEAQRLAQIGNWRWDIAANRVYWSAEVFRIYGRDPELTLQTYEEQLKFYTPESAARLHAAVANAMSDGTAYALDLERDNSRQDNSQQDNSQQDNLQQDNSPRDTAGSEPTQWVTARGEAFRDASGQIVQLRGTVQDITARKLAEAALSESEQRFRDTFKLMPAAVTLQTEAGVLIDASDVFCQVTGYSREEAIDQNVLDLNLWVEPEQRVVMREVLQRDGQVDGVEVLLRRRGGDTYTTMQVSARYLTIGGERLLLAFAHDITERKQADAELLVALNEKTALLKEVHHRVKNNLQVITSLLSLEAARCNDLATKTVLKDMKGRIRSMALLHETLYRTGIFAGVDLSRYLKQLATEVFRTMATTTTATAVSLECALTPLHLEMDQALPCGLLINELLTNSLKHAFPQGGKGIVNVELKLIDDIVHLSVSDTGVGLAPNFNLQQMASLGLHLVADLATQLGGTLQIETGQGATFVVTFALKNPLAAPLHHVNV
jgi:PAS domain S-box-containing protein